MRSSEVKTFCLRYVLQTFETHNESQVTDLSGDLDLCHEATYGGLDVHACGMNMWVVVERFKDFIPNETPGQLTVHKQQSQSGGQNI